ncbi:MAG TPA: SRPBCC domain-containing protein [Terriglobales bacterium]|nr:SRPBCC domain-containing protein [Terriglobales bacterium]
MSPDVVVEVDIRAPVEAVWRLLVEPAELVRWLGISATLEPRPEGRFRFELFPGQFCSGRYLEILPPRRVVLTWGWEDPAVPVPPGSTTVAIDLEAQGPELTALRLVHSGLEAAMRPLHEEGWHRYLARLAAVAAGEQPPPDPSLPYQGADAAPNPLARGDEP